VRYPARPSSDARGAPHAHDVGAEGARACELRAGEAAGERGEQSPGVRGGDPAGHRLGGLDGEQGRTLVRGIEQHARRAGVRGDDEDARGREAHRAPPVRIGDQHHLSPGVRPRPLSGNRQAARPSLAREAGEAHFYEHDTERGRRDHRPRERFLARGVPQGGTERTRPGDRRPDRREPLQGYGAQRATPGVFRVDHVRAAAQRGARFGGSGNADQ